MHKIGRKGIWLFLILMFVLQLTSQAQNKKHFIITGKIVPEGGETVSGVIEVTKNGKETSRIDIPKNGRFRFELEFFNEFSLKFQYPGHFDKIILVSTEIPQEVWERDSDFPPFPMVVQLLKEFEGIDKSFSLKPSGRIFYGKDIDNFEKESYISDIQFVEQIENAKSIANQVQKESESISKENAQDLASKQKSFEQTIKEADTHYQRGEYQMALLKYLEARKLFPDKAYPNDRVAELQDLVKALEITEKQKADLEQKYKAAITRGNGFFDQKSYREARPVYEEALQYKLGDVYANGRINEIDQLLALLDKQKQYNQNIQSGATLSQQKDYMSALAQYKKALELKPDSQLAKDKIAEMELAMVGIETDKKYLQAIQLADQALASNDFQQAKMQYQEALKIKGNEAYPSGKLAEIEKTEANEINFNALTAKAEKAYADTNIDESLKLFEQALELKPKNALVQNRINELQNLKKQQVSKKEYDDLILQADQSFSDNQLDASLATYNRALSLNKSEAYPKDQIKKIETYQSLIKKADKSFNSQDYSSSLDLYNQALTQIPNGTVASGKIAEINGILGDKKKLEEQAKAELNAYNDLVKVADELFTALKYTESITKYQEAANLRTSESYPKKRIKEIATILEGLEKDKAQKEKEYLAVISPADQLFKRKDYPNALAEYRKALKMKPEDGYPQDQIAKIDDLLSLAEKDKALAQQKAKQDSLQKEKDKVFELAMASAKDQNYTSVLKKGDRAFNASSWQDARVAYTEALSVKPNEAYPTNRLNEVNQKIADANMTATSNAAEEKAYHEALAEAEKALKVDQLTTAKMQFEVARSLNPDEKLPVQRIKEIDILMDQRNKDRLAQSQRELDEKYRQALSVADNSFKEKTYTIAKLQYQQALLIKPEESYPKTQIVLIDKLLSEAKPVETYAFELPKTETIQTVPKPIYNPAETAQATEARAQSYTTTTNYDEAVKKADDSFGIKDYSVARFFYLKASEIKPSEEYPKKQLELIRKLIDSQLSNSDISGYEQAIAQADAAFDKKTYGIAKFYYYKALEIKSWEKYPKDRINEILALTNSLLSEKEEKEYRDIIAIADEAYFNKDIAIARFYYNRALSIKKDENYPSIKLKDIQKLIEQDRNDQEKMDYQNIIDQADQAMQSENFSIARFNYNKALTMKPDEKHPKDQLKKIKEALDKKKN